MARSMALRSKIRYGQLSGPTKPKKASSKAFGAMLTKKAKAC